MSAARRFSISSFEMQLAIPEPILQLAFPSRCGLCGLLGDKPICAICEAGFTRGDAAVQTPDWRGALDGVARLFRYQGRSEQAVQRLKFSRATVLARPMSAHLIQYVEELGLDAADLVIPVPIHWSRRFYRGFNQSELLCEAFPREVVSTKALKRVRATRPQVGLSPDERRQNLRNAFACGADVAGKKVLLVDDVITTGHTVGECAKTLKNAGVLEVMAIAFAGS